MIESPVGVTQAIQGESDGLHRGELSLCLATIFHFLIFIIRCLALAWSLPTIRLALEWRLEFDIHDRVELDLLLLGASALSNSSLLGMVTHIGELRTRGVCPRSGYQRCLARLLQGLIATLLLLVSLLDRWCV